MLSTLKKVLLKLNKTFNLWIYCKGIQCLGESLITSFVSIFFSAIRFMRQIHTNYNYNDKFLQITTLSGGEISFSLACEIGHRIKHRIKQVAEISIAAIRNDTAKNKEHFKETH